MKENILKTIHTFQYACFFAGTAVVLALQFLGYSFLILTALALYTAGFLLASIRSIINAIEIFVATNKIKEDTVLLSTSKVEVLNGKSERVKAVIQTVLWLAVFGFSLAVLIMFAIQ